ncbi:NapC/NirT family cytochrome c [Pasteurellaceae bacterium LIM206]|nr:NapC/NirT family cytochrome c [Pasteurellaceae bacterium LIM206]
MTKGKKLSLWGVVGSAVIGALILFGTQFIMKKTSTSEFCASCHSMDYPRAEWEGSSHFSNQQGIRAECADCHVPDDGLDYVKAKFVALKDVWYTITDKLPDLAAYEKHRAEMAQSVWDEMKANDSAACRSCHSFAAMELTKQSKSAQQFHNEAKADGQTCIDCHKGIVHFLPEVEQNPAAANALSQHQGQFNAGDSTLYTLAISTARLLGGEEIRFMPYAELTDWKAEGDQIIATVQGWQQAGAESLLYKALGKRINVAVLSDEAKAKLHTLQTVHDPVTDSEWREVSVQVKIDKSAVTSDLAALDAFGNNLNQSQCSGCHAAIGADHYTANQWIGVINSMKDRTSMTDADVRAVTIYLQRHAKDMNNAK